MSIFLRKNKGVKKGQKHDKNIGRFKWADFDDEYEEGYDDEYDDEYDEDEGYYGYYETEDGYGYGEYDEDDREIDDDGEYEDDDDQEEDGDYEDEDYELDDDGEHEDYDDDQEEDDEYEEDGDYEDEDYELDDDGEHENYDDDQEEDDEYEEDGDYEDEDYELDDDGEHENYDDDQEEDEDDEDYDGEGYELDDDGEYEDYDDDQEDDEYEDYDDEDYEEEDYDDDIPPGGIKKVVYKFTHLSVTDHLIAFTSVAVLVLAVVTGTMYLNAKSSQAQIETFAEIGEGLEDISIIGESGLVAIADAQAAKLMAANMEEDEEEDPEEDTGQEENGVGGRIEVSMHLTSIQKDLKIKFTNKKTGKLIPNLGFEVEIEKPSGGTYTMKDDDKDGIIYQTGIEAGKYKVKITAPVSDEDYYISGEAMAVTVKDSIAYEKVDVSDEVKTEAQVNVSAEDTKVNQTVVESTNTDTVEWVESTKTLIEGTEQNEDAYEKVDSSLIADPGKKASARFALLVGTRKNSGAFSDLINFGEAGQTVISTVAQEEATPMPSVSTPEDTPTSTPTSTPDGISEPSESPTQEPTSTPEETSEPTPQAPPSQTPAPTQTPTSVPTATPSATAAATATPSASPTATPSATPSATPIDAKNDTTSVLKTTGGETLYIKNPDGTFREAKYADFYTAKEFYRKVSKTTGQYRYTGWQTIDGVTYFFDKNGDKVTGDQVIQGAKYSFNSDGSLNSGSGHLGIDVSKWNGNIDWNAVKNSGVSYAIIRCGYRGSTSGALIEDPMFRSNIQGASKAGLKVGVYFFTQAVNEVEAVEEASMVLGLIKGYNISYPVFLDVESSNGRADGINASVRTAVCKAFCATVQNSGYKAGVYANKTWFNSYMDAPSLSGYKIWLAQYAAAPSYNRTRYDIWQYSSKGNVSGIKGNVDMNISYMGY